MSWLLRLIRIPLLLIHIILGFILSFLAYAPWLNPLLPKFLPPWIVTTWSRVLMMICGVRIRYHGQREAVPTLFISNHVSWLDIFSLLGTFHVTFVSKEEVRDWTVIGWLATRVGTLYMKRGNNAMQLASGQMVSLLESGHHVLLFPEGTTTDGTDVKRFFARMFQAGMDAGVNIQPIALRYTEDQQLSQTAPFIDDDSFVAHVWRLFAIPSVTLDIHYCPVIETAGKTRRELSEASHQSIRQTLGY
ncbi:lysophospholipid acyltransferase family protein [Candidatus Albibeggiatoa sp. nov. NOAA]|uniref:lysophospholipid acyltransferase family protein n=1 Tax=Candidatus Albibeggiatoa sp. nov. NOAA TaxID=3162724 RepID=UPI003300ED52|nr:1-acyl-sn-glycerol-3-phosphate acyltransferase [Thiotrichaceae bacterium]